MKVDPVISQTSACFTVEQLAISAGYDSEIAFKNAAQNVSSFDDMWGITPDIAHGGYIAWWERFQFGEWSRNRLDALRLHWTLVVAEAADKPDKQWFVMLKQIADNMLLEAIAATKEGKENVQIQR